jgi:hypothetical protein
MPRILSGVEIAGLDLKAPEALARKEDCRYLANSARESPGSCGEVPGWYIYHISYS